MLNLSYVLLFCALLAPVAHAQQSMSGFHDESEVGVVLVEGNSQTATYNLSQQNTYGWDKNLAKFNGKLLRASSRGIETSRYWTLGLRYERELTAMLSTFLAYTAESDIFAGFDPRHNVDAGMKYFFYKEDAITWLVEAGYRLTREHKTITDTSLTSHFARLYTEASRQWNKTTSTKVWLEYLPNFTTFQAYRVNAELSASASLTDTFSMKLGYLMRYNNVPLVVGGYRADRFFTAALVAKF